MGKILTYLGVSEEGQSRDVLDAERILEGMQMIYSTAPDGSKKNNFAIPLTEMTKVFIEKVKGIKPKEQPSRKLPFKVGDRFKQSVGEDFEQEYGIYIFTILSIDLSGNTTKEIEIEGNYGKKGSKRIFNRDVDNVIADIEAEWWIPYEDEEMATAQEVAGLLANFQNA